MATMNKPAANDENWYQAVTDNWTSIETNLVDKSAFAAKGDLLAASGASALSRLPVGSNGQILTPDMSQAAGVKWDDPMDMAHSLLLKSFFKDQGLMPSTAIKEALYTWPTADFANLNTGTLALSMSRAKFTPVGNPANFGWSLGGTYTKVLVIVGGIRPISYDVGILICNTLPSAPDPADGYLLQNEPGTSTIRIYKSNGAGSYTMLASDSTIFSDSQYYDPSCALAAYVDGTANRVVLWSRMGSEAWMTIHDITDSSLTSFKYAGITLGNAAAGDRWLICPLAIYAQ